MHKTMMSTGRWLWMAAVAAVIGSPQGAQAAGAAAPGSGPMTFVVTSTAGGGVDVTARLIAQHLGGVLGRSVIVENRPGASGTIAGTYVLRSPADGATLLFTASNFVQSAAQSQRPPYAVADFAPVSRIGLTNLILVANPDVVKARTITELIEDIKAQPDKYSYGSYGYGTSAHIYGEILKRSAGIRMTHVPYKGVAPMVNDVVSGQIALAFADIGTATPFLKAQRLRALAISGSERFPGLPDVPTFKERGIAGLELTGWYGLLAPGGTDKAVVQRLAQAVDKVLQMPAVRSALVDRGVAPAGGPADQFARQVAAEEAEWTRVIRENDIHAD